MSEGLFLEIKNLIRAISFAYQSLSIYEEEHPRLRKAIEEVFSQFEGIFQKTDEVSFGVVAEELFSGKEVFFDLSLQMRDFIRVLKEKEIDYLKFRKGLQVEEFMFFLKLLREKGKTLNNQGFLKHIQLGRFGTEEGISSEPPRIRILSLKERLLNILFYYESLLKEIVGSWLTELSQGRLDTSFLRNIINNLFNILIEDESLLISLLSLKKFQDYTFVHCLNVAVLSMFQAKVLKFSQEEVVRIGLAGLLHDIGKIAVSKGLLEKSDILTREEFEKIKSHTLKGARIILASPSFDELSLIVSFEHHLGFDLKGYPKVRFLKKQNLVARIVSISDVYDSLRSRRPYKEPLSSERIYEFMQKEKGRLFDPYLLDLFYKHLGVWPIGTLVKLDTQEVGLVREVNPDDIFRPKIEVFYDSQGRRLEESIIVDLTQKDEEGNYRRRILREMSPYGEGQKFISELAGEEFLS